MRGGDVLAARQVCRRARHLDDAGAGAGGKAQPLEGEAEGVFAVAGKGAEAPHFALAHVGIGAHALAGSEPLALESAGALDARLDGGGAFGGGGGRELFVADGVDFYLHVDAVQQRAADAGAVSMYCGRGAGAHLVGTAVVAAGAGIHAGDQHEIGGEGDGTAAARDGDAAVFQGLAQRLEGGAVVFGHFV